MVRQSETDARLVNGRYAKELVKLLKLLLGLERLGTNFFIKLYCQQTNARTPMLGLEGSSAGLLFPARETR